MASLRSGFGFAGPLDVGRDFAAEAPLFFFFWGFFDFDIHTIHLSFAARKGIRHAMCKNAAEVAERMSFKNQARLLQRATHGYRSKRTTDRG